MFLRTTAECRAEAKKIRHEALPDEAWSCVSHLHQHIQLKVAGGLRANSEKQWKDGTVWAVENFRMNFRPIDFSTDFFFAPGGMEIIFQKSFTQRNQILTIGNDFVFDSAFSDGILREKVKMWTFTPPSRQPPLLLWLRFPPRGSVMTCRALLRWHSGSRCLLAQKGAQPHLSLLAVCNKFWQEMVGWPWFKIHPYFSAILKCQAEKETPKRSGDWGGETQWCGQRPWKKCASFKVFMGNMLIFIHLLYSSFCLPPAQLLVVALDQQKGMLKPSEKS